MVSYNILCQRLVSRFVGDPHLRAAPYALDEAYRWTLLHDQLRLMHGSVLCLQEVDSRTWSKYLHPAVSLGDAEARGVVAEAAAAAAEIAEDGLFLRHYDAYFTKQGGGAAYGLCTLLDRREFVVESFETVDFSSVFKGGMGGGSGGSGSGSGDDDGGGGGDDSGSGSRVDGGVSWFRDLVLHPHVLRLAGLPTCSGADAVRAREAWVATFLKPANLAQVSPY